jgi:nucleosome-remodeling factor subunit BPTF
LAKEEQLRRSVASTALLPKDASGDVRMTRRTTHELSSGTFFFKLGQEGTYKTFVNQFSTNPSALAKIQANEERIKKQSMSHKFSLTDVSSFKWNGALHGSRLLVVATLRQTMLQLEANIPTLFMHPNWSLLRKPWIGAVSASNTPRDFARALTVLQCCMKPCVMLTVWAENQLGHTHMKKITAHVKDDKKRMEKRDKKDKEDEEERLRPFMMHVKYTLGLKHQVSKQKGEEYRAHGQHGWLWLSSTRSFLPSNSNKLGLRAGPHRLAVKYSDIRDGTFKVVLMEPKAFNYLVSKQDEMDIDKAIKKEEKEEAKMDVDEVKEEKKDDEDEKTEEEKVEKKESDEPSKETTKGANNAASSSPDLPAVPADKQTQEKKRLEEALKNARLEKQQITEEMLVGAIDICGALSNPTRVLYPKVAKKAKFLDDFLARRLQLKTLEERRIEIRNGKSEGSSAGGAAVTPSLVAPNKDKKPEESDVDIEGESDTKTAITSSLAPNQTLVPAAIVNNEERKETVNTFCSQAKKAIWAMISRVKDMSKGVKQKRPDSLQCYSAACRKGLCVYFACYSVTCRNFKSDHPALGDASRLFVKLATDAKMHGLDVKHVESDMMFLNREIAITDLQNLVATLMKKKAEFDEYSAMGMSTVTTTTTTATSSTTVMTEKVTKVNGSVDAVTKTTTSLLAQSKTVASEKKDGETGKTTETEEKREIKVEADHKEVSANKTEVVATAEKVKAKVEIKAKDGAELTRVYSSEDTMAKLYLKRIQSVAESKKHSKVVKYPLAPHFYAKTRKKRNILLLAKHDVKRMARRAGTVGAEGYNYNAKSNSQVWPYPCPRPVFKTTWLYRTACVESIQSVALQLRVLWACVRWDDMIMRPLSVDGKHQQTTDCAITTTEILKQRQLGRFLEKTQYFQRKVTIPLDVPKVTVEVAPIRSGLRKRKRAESPQQSEPKVKEEWVDETRLDLWEIRAFREKIERDKNASLTRTRTGVALREPQRLDPSSEAVVRRVTSGGSTDIKTKMDETFRSQKVLQSMTPSTPTTSIIRPNAMANTTPTIIRRVTNADGTISLVRSVTSTMPRQIMANQTPLPHGIIRATSIVQPQTKKLFISKDGKVIGAQVLPNAMCTAVPPRISLPMTPILPGSASLATTPSSGAVSTPSGPQQKVQIVRSSDGKIQVRGLLPGQQLVQMPDGKLQIFTNPNASPVSVSGTPQTSTITKTPVTSIPAQKVVSAAIATLPQTPKSVVTTPNAVTPGTPQQPKQIVAQQLAPGSPIPAGHTAFISNGKTYCIPKAATAFAQQQANKTLTTTTSTPMVVQTLPTTALVTTPATPNAITTAPSATTTTPKQMMEVKPLGANSVTFKGHQMIVSGPDMAQAQSIAKQLSSGAARLATYNGKQVLISTTTATPTMAGSMVAAVTPAAATAATPTAVTPVTTATVPALPTQPLPQSAITSEPVTPPPKPVQVTAQLLQTAQGPRIVLQGIQGSNLPKEDLALIQQQVKHQLLKAQAEAKQQNKVPPTKIVIDLPTAIQAKLQQQQANEAKDETKSPKPPSVPLPSVLRPPTIQLPTTPVAKQQIVVAGVVQTPKMVVMNQQGSTKIIGISPGGQPMINQQQQPQSVAQQQTSLLLQSLTPQRPVGLTGPNAGVMRDGKFEVTPDYIQTAINSALQGQNLTPEIEQKLLALQHHNSSRGSEDGAKMPKVAKGDEEWEPGKEEGLNAGTTRTSARRKRPTLAAAANSSDESPISDVLASLSPIPQTLINSVQVAETIDYEPPLLVVKSPSKAVRTPTSPAANASSEVRLPCDEKRKQQLQNKMESLLIRQKEHLKRDIGKKRALQEKELQIEIHRDIEHIKSAAKEATFETIESAADVTDTIVVSPPIPAASVKKKSLRMPERTTPRENSKRKRQESGSIEKRAVAEEEHETPLSESPPPQPSKKKKRNSSSSSSAVAAGIIKKDKVYCVCKTKYDPKK